MNRYSNPSSGLFDIYAETLRRYSYTPTIPGQDAPRPLPSPIRVLSFFLSVGNISQRERISVRAVAEEGVIQLRSRERALLRQGQLFEPAASSGPAAMVLAISRNLSCIPRRSPCPGRYPLPLAFGFPPTFRSLNCILLTDFLPRPISSPSSVRFALRLHTKKSGIFSHPKDTGLLSAISWK